MVVGAFFLSIYKTHKIKNLNIFFLKSSEVAKFSTNLQQYNDMNVNSVVTSYHFSPGARKKSLPLHVSIRSVAHVHKVDGYHLTW